MRRPNPADVLFWSLAAVATAAFVFFALVLAGAVPIGSSEPAAEATEPLAAPSEPEDAETKQQPSTAATTLPAKKPATRLVTVLVTATRGDCWLSARVGTESGRVLEERILAQGESVRLRAARIWLSLGASSNVDVVVDEQPREVPAGTVELLLAPRSTT